jgi:hypothetical protein
VGFFFGFGRDSGHQAQWGEVFGHQESGRNFFRDFLNLLSLNLNNEI